MEQHSQVSFACGKGRAANFKGIVKMQQGTSSLSFIFSLQFLLATARLNLGMEAEKCTFLFPTGREQLQQAKTSSNKPPTGRQQL